MNLIQIEYFMNVAESGSFRQTAEKMYVSQPAVSKQISLLENEWNVILFNRKYRSAILTKAGRIMYDYFKEAKDSFQVCYQQARLADRQASSELKIGLMENAEVPGFLDICSRFHKKYPSVFLTLASTPIYQLTLEQSDGPFDIVVNHSLHFHNPDSIETILLYRGDFTLLCPKGHPLTQGNFDPENMKGEHLFISATSDHNTTLHGSSAILSRYGITSPDFFMLPNLDSVIQSVKAGLGIAALDSCIRLPDDDSLEQVYLDEKLDYLLAWRRDNDNIAIRFFADMVRECMPQVE